MKDNLIFWKKKLKKSSPGGNTIVIIVGFLIITLCAVGTGLYIKKVNDEKLAANVERQKT
ncbi:hypothetical protein MPB68_004617, partial [Salmonella enterica]|nr:hypothetical protein [Salmonella enterica]